MVFVCHYLTPVSLRHIDSIGDTGEMHAELPESLGVPWCKFIFPTASVRPVTLHHGIMQPSWFDISSIDGALLSLSSAVHFVVAPNR
jgi:hypothetical protein